MPLTRAAWWKGRKGLDHRVDPSTPPFWQQTLAEIRVQVSTCSILHLIPLLQGQWPQGVPSMQPGGIGLIRCLSHPLMVIQQAVPLRAAEGKGEDMMAKEFLEL